MLAGYKTKGSGLGRRTMQSETLFVMAAPVVNYAYSKSKDSNRTGPKSNYNKLTKTVVGNLTKYNFFSNTLQTAREDK